MSNPKFVNALKRQPQAVPPIWFMRQAGRYHKHYQGLRSKYSFMELCKQPKVAAEVALGPIEDFDFDVSILFSDLLFPLEVLGMGLEYTDKGPQLGWQLSEETLSQLRDPDKAWQGLIFQQEALQETRKVLPEDKSLIGFVGGPWTLFTYAVEGRHAGHLINPKTNFSLFENFCERLVPLLIKNIELQLEGGAEVVMVFDTAAGEVSPGYYQKWISPQLQKLINQYPGRLGYYSKGTQPAHFLKDQLIKCPWAGFGFDHRWDLSSVFPMTGQGFVQGNFDQTLLFSAPNDFEMHLRDFLKPFKVLSPEERAGWVCGLGHGVLPQTPEQNVRQFVQIVREVLSD